MATLVSPLHNWTFGTVLIVVPGLICMLNVVDGPVQVCPLNNKVGLTVTRELAIEVVLVLAVLNTGIFPVPVACSPIAVFALVQL